MTTQVQPNDPDALIRRIREELRENPEARTLLLRDLLSENLLQLPARLDALSETVAQNAIAIANLSDRFTDLFAAQQRTEERFDRLAESQQRTEERFEERFDQFMQSQQRMDNDINTLKGWGLELISRRRIPEFAKAPHSRRLEEVPSAELRRLAEDSYDYGHITETEMDDVSTADVVFYGRRRDSGAHAYLVAQVSYSLHPSDVIRAVEQAAVLAKITGIAAFPVIVGSHLTPQAATEIQRHGSVPYVHIVNGNRLRA